MTSYDLNSDRNQLTIRRILKVNHAGEYGAIRIYRAQLWVAQKWYPDLIAFLKETLDHEIKHCDLFFKAMRPRGAKPCRIMSAWGKGGYVLGFTTALMGRQSIWICTSAVEATVHKHLEDQLAFLAQKDVELVKLIESIQKEELHHLDHANAHIVSEGSMSRLLRFIISVITDMLIWLSTWGDSTKMARDFKRTQNFE